MDLRVVARRVQFPRAFTSRLTLIVIELLRNLPSWLAQRSSKFVRTNQFTELFSNEIPSSVATL